MWFSSVKYYCKMDKVTAEELFEINEANKTFVNSVLKLSAKLSLDVTRPLLEKNYRNAKVASLCSGKSLV